MKYGSYFTALIFLLVMVIGIFLHSQSLGSEDIKPQMSLNGIVLSEDDSSCVAILKDERNEEIILLHPGESIYGYQLTKVFQNRIIMEKGGIEYQIFYTRGGIVETGMKQVDSIKKEKGIEVKPKGTTVIHKEKIGQIKMEFVREEVEERIEKEWTKIMQETRFVPYSKDDRIQGFKITKIPKDTILSQIGIKKNDILKEINRVVLDNVTELLGLYDRFKSYNRIELVLERNGKLMNYLYILK